jgi:hypothetical protein
MVTTTTEPTGSTASRLGATAATIRPKAQPAKTMPTIGSRSRLCWRSSAVASSRLMPTGAVTNGIGVITSSTLVVAHSATGVKRRSRLVMMPSKRSDGSTTGRPLMWWSSINRAASVIVDMFVGTLGPMSICTPRDESVAVLWRCSRDGET